MGQIMVRLICGGSVFAGVRIKAGSGKGGGGIHSTSSTLAVCRLHLDRSVHLRERKQEGQMRNTEGNMKQLVVGTHVLGHATIPQSRLKITFFLSFFFF